MSHFILFGTEGCHLCDDAEHLLWQAGLTYEKRDIIENAQWLQRYAIRIPVLWHPNTERELGWPFDAEQLRTFVGTTTSDQG